MTKELNNILHFPRGTPFVSLSYMQICRKISNN
ncbi:hypothetical protein T12_13511 [Trichinella patagoniensis]|uniref:Uncharacterized protein n=1 Tax=Trichinella patagoniensis TaxID=990121 RepID=A0A0V0YVC6_9BILA|nr:hypothetical protein T12_13511 [Trichinella patagoniensis]